MPRIQSVLITGANAGLGRETARQLALRDDIQKIYLACRNESKALEAKRALEVETGRKVFEIIIVDVSDLNSVRRAVSNLKSPVDAVILNAGGTGGREPHKHTSTGVTNIFAVNLLGHTALVNEMLERQLITSSVLYAGSEAARGIPKMGVGRPKLETYSVEEFISIAEGSKYPTGSDPLVEYGAIKLMGALWMASMARKHPHIRFVTISPGGTTGTNGMDDLPFLKKVMFKYIGGTLMPLFGMMHSVDVGAARYVQGLISDKFKSGHFYASQAGFPTGPLVDQARTYDYFMNTTFEDNVHQALQKFIQS